MKSSKISKLIIAIFAVIAYSCSSDSNGDSDGGGTPNPQYTSISISASANSVELGSSITFTVTANDGTDITSSSNVLVNNSSISGNVFTATATGDYQVKATYQSLTSSQISVQVTDPVITALRVETNSASIKVGDTSEITVIGTDAGGTEYTLTETSTIQVNGTDIVGNKHMAVTMGDLTITASRGELTTTTDVTVTVNAETAPGAFEKNAVIEDYTGEWCGWCPRVSYAIEQVEMQSSRVFAIAIHSGDPMQNAEGGVLISQFNPSGSYPTAIINRDADWTYPEPSNVSQATNLAMGTTTSGLSLNTLLKGNQMQIYVNAAFAQAASGNKLVVVLLEDGIEGTQANYTSYYGGVDPINNFVHDHTFRDAITAPLGDAIPSGSLVAGGNHSVVYDMAVPATVSDSSKMSVVAMIVGADNKVINAQFGYFGEDKDFQ